MTSALTFDADTHTYRYDGRVVPSVTQVLDTVQFLSGIPWSILNAAREFGSHVHLACHLWNIGALDEEALDPHLKPYLEGYKSFLSETGFVVVASEQRVFNRAFGYAGTADLFGDWQRTTWVADLKSGAVPWTVGSQLAAYQQARDPRPRRRLCVQLTGNGRYKLTEHTDLADFALFTSALNVYNAIKKHHPKEIQNVSEFA